MPIIKINAKHHSRLPQITSGRILESNFHHAPESCILRHEIVRGGSLIGGAQPAHRATEETFSSLSR